MSRELESKMPVQLRHSTDNAVNNMLQRATDSKADDKLAKEHVYPIQLMYKVSDPHSAFCLDFLKI